MTEATGYGESRYPSPLFCPGFIQDHQHHGGFSLTSVATGLGLQSACPMGTDVMKSDSSVLGGVPSRTDQPLLYFHIVKTNTSFFFFFILL